MKIGIVGLGKMGILHAGIVNSLSDAQVQAICEKDILMTKLAKGVLPKTVKFYRDHMRMIENEELDAVFVTTPIDGHVPILMNIIQTRPEISIFVEKPLAASGGQAQEACDAAHNMRGIHMVGFQKRFSPVFQQARELIENGAIGELICFRAQSFSSDVLRQGKSWRFARGTGGVLLDLAPHVLDMLIWFFGEPHSVLAASRSVYSQDVEDYAHAILSFRDGLQGHVEVCWSMKNYRLPEMSIEVQGTNGNLIVTDDYVKLESNERGLEAPQTHVNYKQSFDTSLTFLLADPEYTKEDEAFLSAVKGRNLPEPNFFEAAKVNTLMDRMIEARQGSRLG